jgi:peptidoglycan/LPS O-acetylase OafA/YrhL
MQTPSSLNSNLITKGHIITEGQSTVLDWTRAAAAQVVLMAHLAEWFYVPFREKAKMVYISSAGSLAVAIFFVLSGALITNSISHQIRAQKFRLLHYARSRIARIYPTLLAALGITVICYILIKHLGLHGYPAYDKNDFVGEITRDSAQIKPSTVAATGLFLNGMIGIPGWHVGTVSMNGPLWSLAHEFWFYVIAGLWGAYLSSRNL